MRVRALSCFKTVIERDRVKIESFIGAYVKEFSLKSLSNEGHRARMYRDEIVV